MRTLVASRMEYRTQVVEAACLFPKVNVFKKIWDAVSGCTPVLWVALFAMLTVIVNVLGR